MSFPPLLDYTTIAEYKTHFENYFCKKPIITFDGIPIYFNINIFSHSFYESSLKDSNKDVFSSIRAQRMNWIKETLENSNADLYQGWDKKLKRYIPSRRVAVVYIDYVVVVEIILKKDGKLKGKFITAYKAENSIQKIRNSPKWNGIK
ncbi:MAG: hypothetical protein KBA11_07790 [Sedimentibacter sp.]|nr:hypothetical protein [Sedimentibacter sp.]